LDLAIEHGRAVVGALGGAAAWHLVANRWRGRRPFGGLHRQMFVVMS
jgi:hypothetical protein